MKVWRVKICPNTGFSFIFLFFFLHSYESLSILISYSKSSLCECLERSKHLLVAKQQIQWKRQPFINHYISPKNAIQIKLLYIHFLYYRRKYKQISDFLMFHPPNLFFRASLYKCHYSFCFTVKSVHKRTVECSTQPQIAG